MSWGELVSKLPVKYAVAIVIAIFLAVLALGLLAITRGKCGTEVSILGIKYTKADCSKEKPVPPPTGTFTEKPTLRLEPAPKPTGITYDPNACKSSNNIKLTGYWVEIGIGKPRVHVTGYTTKTMPENATVSLIPIQDIAYPSHIGDLSYDNEKSRTKISGFVEIKSGHKHKVQAMVNCGGNRLFSNECTVSRNDTFGTKEWVFKKCPELQQ